MFAASDFLFHNIHLLNAPAEKGFFQFSLFLWRFRYRAFSVFVSVNCKVFVASGAKLCLPDIVSVIIKKHGRHFFGAARSFDKFDMHFYWFKIFGLTMIFLMLLYISLGPIKVKNIGKEYNKTIIRTTWH